MTASPRRRQCCCGGKLWASTGAGPGSSDVVAAPELRLAASNQEVSDEYSSAVNHVMVVMQVIEVWPSTRGIPQLLHCQDLSLPKRFSCRETVFDALPLFGQLFPQLTASGPYTPAHTHTHINTLAP